MNDTSLNVKVNSINVDEGTVSHVAMISSEIYYRVEEPTSGTGTGNLHLLSFIFIIFLAKVKFLIQLKFM